jgi:hypothetical protein
MRAILDERLLSGGAKGNPMRTLFVLLVVAAVAMCADADTRWGIAVNAPLALTVQLSLPGGLAVEVGVPRTGPAFCAAKLYLASWHPAGVRILPVVGLGGAVAFLPGNIVAAGFFAVVGLEFPIPETRLSLLADLVALIPLPIGAGTLDVSPKVGLRLAF